jgi:hypothetical protein
MSVAATTGTPESMPCPACAKKNTLPLTKCGRCQCDLRALQRVISSAEAFYRRSLELLAVDELEQALEAAQTSWQLWHRPKSAMLAGIIATRMEHIPTILHWQELAGSV